MTRHIALPAIVLAIISGLAGGLVVAQVTPLAPAGQAEDGSTTLAQLRQIVAQQEAIIAEERQLVDSYKAMIKEQQETIEQLKRISEAMTLAAEAVAPQNPASNSKAWHLTRIEQNRESYTAIQAALGNVNERNLPTARAWYGDAWKRLTQGYADGQFPSAKERNALVNLMDEIRLAERRRVAVMTATRGRAFADANATLPTTSQWLALRTSLMQLKF